MGWAEITHPFHPRRGQRFQVLKVRRVSGVETLSLRESSGGTLCVPREWTDLGDASPYADIGIEPQILDSEHLVALAQMLEQIAGSQEGG